MLDFDEALAYLDGFVNYERRPPDAPEPRDFGLDRVRDLLRALGGPHERLRCFHVAGTKGKGSTAAMTESILRAAGYRTGLYTSPHLVDVRERIRIDGEMIPREEFARLTERTRPHIEELKALWAKLPPGSVRRATYFEILTDLAFAYFDESRVDAAVLEVGLGGRLDATNVIEKPVACAITSIGYDHTEMLGETLGEIAGEKAGILKPGRPAVVAPQEPSAAEAIRAAARRVGAPLRFVGSDIVIDEGSDGGFAVRAGGRSYERLTIPLRGAHQRENAAVTVGLADIARDSGYERVNEEAVREGLASVSWPGRIQKVADSPVTILDGAHNVESVRALVRTLAELYPGRKAAYAFAALGDKPWKEMLRELRDSAAALVATTATYARAGSGGAVRFETHPRAADAAELAAGARRARIARVEVEPDPAKAFERAREIARSLAGDEGLAVATGSLYLTGRILALFPEAAEARG